MTEKKKKMSDVMVLMKYFGKQPGQALADFKKEIDALSKEDKKELVDLARPYVEADSAA